MKLITQAIKILKASEYYSDLLDSFSSKDTLNGDSECEIISKAIYFHICKMKYAGWRHRVNFRRYRKHSFSEFFQDIVAFYLKKSLSTDYTIELENKNGKIQPDIAIKRGDKYVFLIEVKTNIGWHRDYKENFRDRINKLSETFVVPRENVIYIFEEPSNVSKAFLAKFWDKEKQQRKPRPIDFPDSNIFPLFNATDPFYWKHRKEINKDEEYVKIPDTKILKQAKENIVTPFEEILRRIRAS